MTIAPRPSKAKPVAKQKKKPCLICNQHTVTTKELCKLCTTRLNKIKSSLNKSSSAMTMKFLTSRTARDGDKAFNDYIKQQVKQSKDVEQL